MGDDSVLAGQVVDTLHTCCRKGSEFDLRSSRELWYASYQGNHSVEHSSKGLIWMQGTKFLVEKAEVEERETGQDNVWLRKE